MLGWNSTSNISSSLLQHLKTSYQATGEKKKNTLPASLAYSLCDCPLLSADGYHKDKKGPLGSEQNPIFKLHSKHKLPLSILQQYHLGRGSLHVHLSSPNFCHSSGNALINMSFTKGWVCHQSNALFVWMRSWMVCLATFAKRCSPAFPIFLSNKEDALPNVLPLRSQRQKLSTLPQEKKKQNSNDQSL